MSVSEEQILAVEGSAHGYREAWRRHTPRAAAARSQMQLSAASSDVKMAACFDAISRSEDVAAEFALRQALREERKLRRLRRKR